jgi:hypothetical protein
MGLFLVLFWCVAVARDVLRHNSGFGVFNTRLGPNKFPFSRLRELPGKGLICLAVFGAKTALFENNRENSRFHGNNRKFWPPAKRAMAQPAVTPICVARSRLSCRLPIAGVQPFAGDGVPRTANRARGARYRYRSATNTASPLLCY